MQNHLVALNCGESILHKYCILMKEDLKSSTAILKPNQPGSTNLKLSWIWQSGKWLLLNDNVFPEPTSNASHSPTVESDSLSRPATDAVTLHECMFLN